MYQYNDVFRWTINSYNVCNKNNIFLLVIILFFIIVCFIIQFVTILDRHLPNLTFNKLCL